MKQTNVKASLLWTAVFYLILNANHVHTDDPTQATDESQIELKPRLITKDNFDEIIQEPLYGTFVMYHAPWCGR